MGKLLEKRIESRRSLIRRYERLLVQNAKDRKVLELRIEFLREELAVLEKRKKRGKA